MTRQERINKLVTDINALVDSCREEEIITYAEIVGVLELIKFDIIKETSA